MNFLKYFKGKKEPVINVNGKEYPKSYTEEEYNKYEYLPNGELRPGFDYKELSNDFGEAYKVGDLEKLIKLSDIAYYRGLNWYFEVALFAEKKELYNEASDLYGRAGSEGKAGLMRAYKFAKEKGIYDQTFGVVKKLEGAVEEKDSQERFKKLNDALGYLNLHLKS